MRTSQQLSRLDRVSLALEEEEEVGVGVEEEEGEGEVGEGIWVTSTGQVSAVA